MTQEEKQSLIHVLFSFFLALWLSQKLQWQATKWNTPLPGMKLKNALGLNNAGNTGDNVRTQRKKTYNSV